MPLSRHHFHLGFFKQDADKNEYLLKASETYEPLNVNFVDLYQVRIQFSSETLGSIKKYTTQITKLPKYLFFRPRLPHVPTRRVVFPRASSLETSRQVLEPPPQVENSLPPVPKLDTFHPAMHFFGLRCNNFLSFPFQPPPI